MNVQAWDNTGIPSSGASYGPIGFDTVPPHTTGQASTAIPAQVTLTATDASSGVAGTVYQLDGGATTTYTGPFLVSAAGSHTLTFHSTDNAGNVENTETLKFSVGATTATAVTSSVNPAQFYQGITFTATVSSAGGTPTGTVTFFMARVNSAVLTLSAGKATIKKTLTLGSLDHGHLLGERRFCGEYLPGSYADGGQGGHRHTLTSTPNPSTLGGIVTFTATVMDHLGQPRRYRILQERHHRFGERDGEHLDT